MADVLQYPIRSDKFACLVEVSQRLADVQSPFQRIEILDTPAFGRMLLLDGHVQLAELDEFAYHEALVHIPLLSMESPQRALVVGGGDGAVVRELVKHPSLESIEMVEIDRLVFDTVSQHMPFLQGSAFSDPRVRLIIGDAFEFVQAATSGYDLIVMDATDVYEEEEGELSERLWTDEFYGDLARLLSPAGVLVTQADNLLFCPYSLADILATWGRIFAHVGSYHAIVPSFGGYSGFAWASHGTEVKPASREAYAVLGCRYLTPETVASCFAPMPFAAS
jgi:spermidine synthase